MGASCSKRSPLPPSTPLEQLLGDESVVLVRKEWLQSNVSEGKPLVRRQDLPPWALEQAVAAVKLIDKDNGVALVSQAWLHPSHPDPTGSRRADLVRVIELCSFNRTEHVFLDFLSLDQQRRTAKQSRRFQAALYSMHLVFGNRLWQVYRITSVPNGAQTSRPYTECGWCLFESILASLMSKKLYTLCSGQEVADSASSVPLTPTDFSLQLSSAHFVDQADAATVMHLYRQAFAILAQNSILNAMSWGDDEVTLFLDALPELTGIKSIVIDNCLGGKVSSPFKSRLEAAMAARGGGASVRQKRNSMTPSSPGSARKSMTPRRSFTN